MEKSIIVKEKASVGNDIWGNITDVYKASDITGENFLEIDTRYSHKKASKKESKKESEATHYLTAKFWYARRSFKLRE